MWTYKWLGNIYKCKLPHYIKKEINNMMNGVVVLNIVSLGLVGRDHIRIVALATPMAAHGKVLRTIELTEEVARSNRITAVLVVNIDMYFKYHSTEVKE